MSTPAAAPAPQSLEEFVRRGMPPTGMLTRPELEHRLSRLSSLFDDELPSIHNDGLRRHEQAAILEEARRRDSGVREVRRAQQAPAIGVSVLPNGFGGGGGGGMSGVATMSLGGGGGGAAGGMGTVSTGPAVHAFTVEESVRLLDGLGLTDDSRANTVREWARKHPTAARDLLKLVARPGPKNVSSKPKIYGGHRKIKMDF